MSPGFGGLFTVNEMELDPTTLLPRLASRLNKYDPPLAKAYCRITKFTFTVDTARFEIVWFDGDSPTSARFTLESLQLQTYDVTSDAGDMLPDKRTLS